MTDEAQIRQRAIAGIIRGVAKKTALLTVGAAAAVLVYVLFQDAGQRWWFLPASVLFGGALGLLNFRWLATAVQRVYLRKGATPGLSSLAAAVISILKLSLIFIILFLVIKWQLLHIFGMVAGLSLSFLAIVWEGAKLMKQTLGNGGSGR
jgi:ATP synthase I chain